MESAGDASSLRADNEDGDSAVAGWPRKAVNGPALLKEAKELWMPRRPLNNPEIEIARSVFRNTLPYGYIFISDSVGLKESLWTSLRISMDESEPSSYILNVGAAGFAGMQRSPMDYYLIHELTHVWQSCNSHFAGMYMARSLAARIKLGDREAYHFEPGKAWDRYNVEQQGDIVAQWYDKGADPKDPLFGYIKDRIRHGRVFQGTAPPPAKAPVTL